jgi:predicted regulator of Ras-like GTPase activity (Roadblock/LC7/MglB family)
MKEIDELLAYLVDNVDGALAAFVGSSDGLLIDQHPKQGQDMSGATAQWTNVLNAMSGVATGLKAGKVEEAIMTAEKVIAYARILSPEIFCIVIMNPSGNIGKARLYSQKLAKNLLEVFA